jgi:hypothetical protein
VRDWQEIRRVEWEHPAPPAPNGSAPPSTDYGVTIWSRYTWPITAESGIYAGRTYERREYWQGPSADYRQHVMFSSCEYPAPVDCTRDRSWWAESELRDACRACGRLACEHRVSPDMVPHAVVGPSETGKCERCGREDYDGIHTVRP